MVHTRTIRISVGSSRKSVSWHTTELTLEEFYARLGQVQRTQETLDTYLSMTKAKQDALKDIGGFVGGQLDGRRQVCNLKGRDLITLDMDHCPTNGTDAIIEKLDVLGCGYYIYSTRKHQPSAPRLRIVIPTDRTMTIEEYEPVARKMAEHIQPAMNWYDPTTFEVTRLMYWASASVDSDVVSRYADKGLLSVDGILAEYDDWRDISQWPDVPGVAAKRQSLAKQQDPTTKTGVIGAFCRSYSISDAIATFLADKYTSAGEGRYTYTGGSTTGGAVVYDDLYLYSHHATDPCSGQEVNAFDLVRLHKFSDLDEDAKPNTPVNRLPSFMEMRKFAQEQPPVKALLDAQRAAEIQAALESSLMPVDRSKDIAACLAQVNGCALTEGIVRDTLAAAGVALRYNEISHVLDIEGFEQFGYSDHAAQEGILVVLEDMYNGAQVTKAGTNAIAARLASIADQNRYNPVKQMLAETAWDGADRITILTDEVMLLPKDDDLSHTLVRKWLRQCVALAFNRDNNPYGADGVLTLQGKQGIGKTTLTRKLAVEPDLFGDGASLAFRDKDSLLQATGYWICELGEMERTLREDEAALKSFITRGYDDLRRPYARTSSKLPRRTSFCGTLNSDMFLRDETGNRRLWTIALAGIDLDRLFQLSGDWFKQLWAQVYVDWRTNGVNSFRLTSAEQEALGLRNAKHMLGSSMDDAIRDLLDAELREDEYSFVSASQIAALLGVKAADKSRPIGRAVSRIIASGEYPFAEQKRSKSKRGYVLPIAKDITLM